MHPGWTAPDGTKYRIRLVDMGAISRPNCGKENRPGHFRLRIPYQYIYPPPLPLFPQFKYENVGNVIFYYETVVEHHGLFDLQWGLWSALCPVGDVVLGNCSPFGYHS